MSAGNSVTKFRIILCRMLGLSSSIFADFFFIYVNKDYADYSLLLFLSCGNIAFITFYLLIQNTT